LIICCFLKDDYDEDEEEEENARPRKKNRRAGVGDFILEEAEVDDEVEEDEEWEDGAEAYNIHEIDEHGPTAREIDAHSRRHSMWE